MAPATGHRLSLADLTGRSDGPAIAPPEPLLRALEAANRSLPIPVDGIALLTERAWHAGLRRNGSTSCGGATRLLRTGDGWIAVGLARPWDVAAAPAWLEADVPAGDPWPAVTDAVVHRPTAQLAARAQLLDLAVATLGEVHAVGAPSIATELDATRPPIGVSEARVVNLSSLWAGPLCARLLHEGGAAVVNVQSAARPDGARQGPDAFFAALHEGHESVVLDLEHERGRRALHALVRDADVVISSARPRALQHLGLDPTAPGERGPKVWVAITGYGFTGDDANRVAFGDDAAVAGGLVAQDADGPMFLADAIADPLSGIFAATAAFDAAARPGRWFLDVALARVAAFAADG